MIFFTLIYFLCICDDHELSKNVLRLWWWCGRWWCLFWIYLIDISVVFTGICMDKKNQDIEELVCSAFRYWCSRALLGIPVSNSFSCATKLYGRTWHYSICLFPTRNKNTEFSTDQKLVTMECWDSCLT